MAKINAAEMMLDGKKILKFRCLELETDFWISMDPRQINDGEEFTFKGNKFYLGLEMLN